MATLRDLFSHRNTEDYIAPRIRQMLGSAINIAETNANEAQIERPLRELIASLANPLSSHSPLHYIQEYLNAPETQNSTTRQFFENIQNQAEPRG